MIFQYYSQNSNLANLNGFTPIVDSTGKITGYKTTIGGADTVFPFSSTNAGYTIPGSAIVATLTGGQSASGILPIKGIKHLRFDYAFGNYYQSGSIYLTGSNGNLTLVSIGGGYNGARYQSVFDQDLDKEYDFLQYSCTAKSSGYAGMNVWNVVATV